MRIAVLEAVSAGFFGPEPEPSLLREGQAMWSAVVTDLAAVPDTQVITVLDQSCATTGPMSAAINRRISRDVVDVAAQCVAALQEADQALIIAPEFSGLLTRLVAAIPPHITAWNAHPSTIALCSDKLHLYEHLRQQQVPTIATSEVDWKSPPDFSRGSYVIKPRDGAGSYLVRRITNHDAWAQVSDSFADPDVTRALLQPYLVGRSVSIAGWFGESGVTILPIAEQHLSAEGEFRYLGGRIPADITTQQQEVVSQLFRDVMESLPGLRGYIGADVILPDDDPLSPVLVEINPRFTTSYVGYRQLWSRSPWPEWLSGKQVDCSWNPARRTVRFHADGTWE